MGATILWLRRIQDSGAHSSQTKDTSQCETENPTMVPLALWCGVQGLEEHGVGGVIQMCLYPLLSIISIRCSLITRTPAEHQLYARPRWSCLGFKDGT